MHIAIVNTHKTSKALKAKEAIAVMVTETVIAEEEDRELE